MFLEQKPFNVVTCNIKAHRGPLSPSECSAKDKRPSIRSSKYSLVQNKASTTLCRSKCAFSSHHLENIKQYGLVNKLNLKLQKIVINFNNISHITYKKNHQTVNKASYHNYCNNNLKVKLIVNIPFHTHLTLHIDGVSELILVFWLYILLARLCSTKYTVCL